MFRRPAPGICALLLLACGGGMSLEAVPSDPIAFMRQEAAKGRLGLETFREGMQLMLETRREQEKRQSQGRKRVRLRTTLMLLTVPTGTMQEIPASGEGSVPLDWSADGSRLLLGRVSGSGPGPIELFTWNRLRGSYARMTLGLSSGGASLGSGPIRLALVRPLPSLRGEIRPAIFVRTVHEGTLLLKAGVGGIDPDVSPDGSTLVFVRLSERVNREPRIFLSRLDEGEGRPIARGSHPRFSRDGRWIVFERRTAGSQDIWRMRGDGTGRRRVVGSSFDEEYPALSPRGSYVVYASARGQEKESQLFLTRIADGAEVQLTQNGQNGRPVW